LDRFDLVWELTADGAAMTSGKIERPAVAPGAAKAVRLALPRFEAQPGVEYFLNVSLRARDDWAGVPKGHVVAAEQLPFPAGGPVAPPPEQPLPALAVDDGPRFVRVSGAALAVRFDKATGALDSFVYQGRELVASAIEPNFWRAPTDNDFGNQMPRRLGIWRQASLYRDLRSISAQETGPGWVSVAVEYGFAGGAATEVLNYLIGGDGRITIAGKLSFREAGKLPEMPRVGLKMAVPAAYKDVRWFGRGPFESYGDRKTAAFVGRYGTTAGEPCPYVSPQEYGNRTDTRWLAVRDAEGWGLLVTGHPLFEFSAHPYGPEDLTQTSRGSKHPPEIQKRDHVCLTLDAAQMGVGGDDSWGARIHPQYTIPAQDRGFRLTLRPLRPGDDPAAAAKAGR
ncbi:MAG TPA: beta-galactosidase domain 4-containing protein, partial [Acidobacteriota bacterium]|nr:beta-galactosidase domain 4-containing protein [Acidobacteriota bacterium]